MLPIPFVQEPKAEQSPFGFQGAVGLQFPLVSINLVNGKAW